MKILTSNFTFPGIRNLNVSGFYGDANLNNVFVNIPNLKISNLNFSETGYINNLFKNSYPVEDENYEIKFDFAKIKFSDSVKVNCLFSGYNNTSGSLKVENLFLNTEEPVKIFDKYDTNIRHLYSNVNIPKSRYVEMGSIYNDNIQDSTISNLDSSWGVQPELCYNVKFIGRINLNINNFYLSQNDRKLEFENIENVRVQGRYNLSNWNIDFQHAENVYLDFSYITQALNLSFGDVSNVSYFQCMMQVSNLNSNSIIRDTQFGNSTTLVLNAFSKFDNITFNGKIPFFPAKTTTATNLNINAPGPIMFQGKQNLVDVSFTNLTITSNLYWMFYQCNKLSNDSIKNIINAFVTFNNQIADPYRNLSNKNYYSPFYTTKFDNSYYTEYHEALSAAGWTF